MLQNLQQGKFSILVETHFFGSRCNCSKRISAQSDAISQKKGCKDVHTLPSYLGSWWFDLMLKVEEALLENLGQGNML